MEKPAAFWAAVRVGAHWGPQGANILRHEALRAAPAVRRPWGGLLGARTRSQGAAGTLTSALVHVRKVTRSSWPGLCPCSPLPDVPRTTQDLAQFLGA